MTIKEAEKLTGVSSRNIRFYEQKGLLTPERNRENDYREYSDGDIERLKLIRALRMVDMPLEQIKRIVDGELSLQLAVAQQKRELRSKIKQIETAVHFCDELEKVDELGIGEVLAHMDLTENKKLLSNKWKLDHTELTKKLLLPFLSGGLLLLVNVGLASTSIPIILMMIPADGYVLALGLLPYVIWCYLGYKLYEKNWWWVKCLLAHIVPVVFLIWLYLNPDGRYELVYMVFWPCWMITYLFTNESVPAQEVFLDVFPILVGVFCLGMLLGKLAEYRRNSGKSKESTISLFFARHEVLRSAILGLAIVALLLFPAAVTDLGPTPSVCEPEYVEEQLTLRNEIDTKIGDDMWYFRIEEDFPEMLSCDEWERIYLRFGIGKEVVSISAGNDKEDAYITFYEGDVVGVRDGGWLLAPDTKIYYRIPKGVVEAVEEYVKANKLRDITE